MNGMVNVVLAVLMVASHAHGALEIARERRTHTMSVADERIFSRDRATYFRTARTPVPPDQQWELFRIRWSVSGVAAVKLEYRQHGSRDTKQVVVPVTGRERSAEIVLRGAELTDLSPITAWRVSLWDSSGTEMASRRSVLW